MEEFPDNSKHRIIDIADCTKEIRKTCDVKDYIEPLYCNFPSNFSTKDAKQFTMSTMKLYLESQDTKLNNNGLKSYLATLNFDISSSYIKAWSSVSSKIDNCINDLTRSDLPIHLICSTIEATHSVPSTHLESKVHLTRTLDELTALVPKNVQLININIGRYTECLLNIVTELIYRSSVNNIQKDYREWLLNLQNELCTFVDEGKPYKFNYNAELNNDPLKLIYDMDLMLFLAHTQEELKPTTLGYPHIHMSILTDCCDPYTVLNERLVVILKASSGLADVIVERESREPNSPTKSMMYVFKNHSSLIVLKNLRLYHRLNFNVIIKSYVSLSSRCVDLLINMLYYISHNKYLVSSGKIYQNVQMDKFSSNAKSYNKSLPMAIYGVKKLNFDFRPSLISDGLLVNKITLLNPEQRRGKNRYLSSIQKYMLENDLAICGGMIYKKRPGSKSSFKIESTIEEFLIGTSKNLNYEGRSCPDIINWMKCPCVHKLYDESEQVVEFPRIKINYRMVEYGDFYFSFITKKIYKTQSWYCTYVYYPMVTLSNLIETICELLRSSVWIKILQASNVYTVEDISTLYRCVLNRKDEKKGTISIVGDSNTGKSTMIEVFISLFPKHLVGRIQKFSEYHVADMVKNKLMVVVNEANTMLRSINTEERGSILVIFEGGTGISNKKMGEITPCDFSRVSLVLTSNIEPGDHSVYSNTTLMNRLQICYTKRCSNDIVVDNFIKAASFHEAPVIVMFSAMCSLCLENSLDFIPHLPICDELDADEYEKIELSEVLDGNKDFEIDERRGVTYFSKNASKEHLKKTSEFEKFEFDELPGRCFQSNSEKITLICSEINKQRTKNRDEWGNTHV